MLDSRGSRLSEAEWQPVQTCCATYYLQTPYLPDIYTKGIQKEWEQRSCIPQQWKLGKTERPGQHAEFYLCNHNFYFKWFNWTAAKRYCRAATWGLFYSDYNETGWEKATCFQGKIKISTQDLHLFQTSTKGGKILFLSLDKFWIKSLVFKNICDNHRWVLVGYINVVAA